MVTAPFYIPTSNTQGSQFLPFLVSACHFPFLACLVIALQNLIFEGWVRECMKVHV